MIRWSDNSLSILIGEELFAVNVLPTQGHQYLITPALVSNHDVIQTSITLDKQLQIVPHTIDQKVHKKLTHFVGQKYKKESRTKIVVTEHDPEFERQVLEKAENEKDRARRRMESKRRNLRGRYELDESFLEEDRFVVFLSTPVIH